MATLDDAGFCPGYGAPDTTDCICGCHVAPTEGCDTIYCSPVAAGASDNVRIKHVNRDADTGKYETKRGIRSLRKA